MVSLVTGMQQPAQFLLRFGLCPLDRFAEHLAADAIAQAPAIRTARLDGA
jgi:hypothetical protein